MMFNWPSLDDFLIHLITALLLLFTGLRLLVSDWSHLWIIFRSWRERLEQKNAIMNTFEIIGSLRNERDRIDAAIVALEGSGGARDGKTTGTNGASRGGRRMSAVARRKISQAQKKRWAKKKKQ